eukprot:616905-Ditylum_brightwellii.AAC.2
MESSYTPITFTTGIDATIVVKSWQFLQSHGDIVGGLYPNQFLDVKGKLDQETFEMMKKCITGKHDVYVAEVKVSVMTIQVVPQGFSPYIALARNVQTINESNDFGKQVVKACQRAAS